MSLVINHLKVVSGRGIGRGLGFPTLNLVIPKNFELEPGVYAARVNLGSQIADLSTPNLPTGQAGSQLSTLNSVLFYGPRKSFDNALALEFHILDTKLEETPQQISLEIIQKIRNVRKFSGKEELKKAIGQDCVKARKILG